MRELYDAIEPFDRGWLKVSDIHELHYEQCGNPEGTPVVFLHGGPGGGIDPMYRRFFDPNAYRIILFDQRGSGQSNPQAELRENTTWDLVADIEKIRELFGIETWVVFGGSWGSTLALAYAETHPDRVRALILRGIFLCRPKEIQWFYQEGANAIYPDVWENYVNVIPEEERGNMVEAYYKRLTGENEEEKLTAARAWSIWEASTSKLYYDPNMVGRFEEDDALSLAFARIECHYFINNCFFETDNWLLENVDKIRHIPTVIVQGRYDVVCPATSAWDLHKAFPETELRIIPDAGHSALEKGIASALVEAADKFRGIGD